MHPAHLARVFRAHHGVSVGEYARRLRLAWAAGELARTDTPLAVIASQAGFADQSHFTRLFRQHLGITPARYRAQTQAAATPRARSLGFAPANRDAKTPEPARSLGFACANPRRENP